MTAAALSPSRRDRGWRIALSTVVAAAAVCLYLPSLGAGFVYDDRAQILTDGYVHDAGHFAEVLTFRVLARDVLDNNRPVNLASMMADAMLWGREPFGYHLTNVILHGLCCWLVFWLAVHLLRRSGAAQTADGGLWVSAAAAAAGLVMATHPVNSEAVCSPAFREDLLVSFFLLVGLLLSARFATGGRGKDLLLGAGIVAAMLASVGAKESGAAGPPILALYWFIFRRREPRRRRWAVLIGAAALVVAAFLAARFVLQPWPSVIHSYAPVYLGGSLAGTLPWVAKVWVFHLRNIVWPDALCADYTGGLLHATGIGTPLAVFVLVLVVVATALTVRKSAMVGLAAGIYWLALLPASNLVPLYRPIADRYLYLPMTGVSVAVAALVMHAARKRWAGISGLAVVGVVAIVLAGLARQRQNVWHDSQSLWRDTLRRAPDSFTAAANLAFERYDRQDYREAAALWTRGTRITKGQVAECWAGLAIGLDALGRTDDADAAFQKAVKLDPAYADPDRLVERLTWERRHAPKLAVVAERNAGKP